MREKTKFYCTQCGNETGKWFGRCPSCGTWNTIEEAPVMPFGKSGLARASSASMGRV